MIQGYVTPSSVSAGKTITIHAGAVGDRDRTKPGRSTKFRSYFFRRGAKWEFKVASDICTANAVNPPNAPPASETSPYTSNDSASDWNWPGFDFTVPKDWRSGVYVAVFLPEDGTPVQPTDPDDARYYYSKALFVVNVAKEDPGTEATILYKVPLFTYCAYNYEGNASLYEVSGNTGLRDFKVTLHRPGCGVGGDPWDKGAKDVYDGSSPRQTFAHWDSPFISWLESNGYNVDYCTDLDVHQQGTDFLKNYRLLVSVGHDEYWSDNMRSSCAQFVTQGGNLAFFSGNTSWWRVSLVDGDTGFHCNKVNQTDQWSNVGKPEAELIGVSYANGGGWWTGQRTPIGFTVQNPDHWVYSGTGLAQNGSFGKDEAIIGYECDGAQLAPSKDRSGNFVPSHQDGCPNTFTILGFAQLDDSWLDPGTRNASDPDAGSRERRGDGTATMGIWEDQSKGTVFNAATTDWARVLNVGNPTPSRAIVDRITRNVLDQLE